MPVYKRKLRRRGLLWAELNALEHFYFGCPNNRAWEKHKAWYLQAYNEILRRKKKLLSIYL